jgi:hypothetical protein
LTDKIASTTKGRHIANIISDKSREAIDVQVHLALKNPSYLDLCRQDISGKDGLHEIWRQNHRVLLSYLRKTEIPYFGLHGTPKERLSSILTTRQGHFELGTFYDKPISNIRLFQLYALCNYVSIYGISNRKQGGILIFNLQEGERNLTIPWEQLYPGSGIECTLGFDSRRESELFRLLGNENNLLWRTATTFDNNAFNKRFIGFISVREVENYVNGIWDSDHNFQMIGRTVVAARLLSQIVLGKVLKCLRSKKNQPTD